MPLEDSTKLNGTLSQGQSLAAGLGQGPRLYGALVDLVPEIKPFLFVTALASGAAFGSLAASNATPKTMALDGLSSGAGFGSPTVAGGILQAIDLTSLASGAAFGSPVLANIEQSLLPDSLTGSAAFGSPVLANVAQALDLTALASGAAFGSPTIALFVQEITLDGLASGAAFGSPTVANVAAQSLSLTGLASGAGFGSPTVAISGQALALTGLASAGGFGDVTLGTTTQTLTLTGLASGAAFGSPTVADVATAIQLDGLASGAAFGSPTVANVAASISVVGFGTDYHTNSTETWEFTLPTHEAGDILFMFIQSFSNSIDSWSASTDWSFHRFSAGYDMGPQVGAMQYIRATSGATTNPTISAIHSSNTAEVAAICYVIRGSIASGDPRDVYSSAGTYNSTVAPPGLTPTVTGGLLFVHSTKTFPTSDTISTPPPPSGWTQTSTNAGSATWKSYGHTWDTLTTASVATPTDTLYTFTGSVGHRTEAIVFKPVP
jgi:hypothetical protein